MRDRVQVGANAGLLARHAATLEIAGETFELTEAAIPLADLWRDGLF